MLNIRKTKKYNKNFDFCKDFVINHCFCEWSLFCENAYNVYNLEFVNKLYKCKNQKEIKTLIYTII